MPFTLPPIGIAHTPFQASRGIPRQGAGPARIEVFPPFRDALDGLERCSHAWIIGFFHLADRTVCKARPRKSEPSAPANGVFSMRSPVRPNPIGLSCARITQLLPDGFIIDRIDFVDQTPVLDIKPYSPGWDLVPSARSAHRYDPSRYTVDELRSALLRDAENALGTEAARTESIARLVDALQRLATEYDIDLRAESTRFFLQPGPCIDLLLCATGATFGNERLAIAALGDHAALRVQTPNHTIDVVVRDGTLDLIRH